MKQFDLKISVDYINLKVKFLCKISFSLKFKAKQYTIVEEQPLTNNTFSSPLKDISNLQAEYNQKEDKFAQNQNLSFILYLHSSHGKLLVGSFSYKLNEFKNKKSIVQKIKNSPDKNAEIKFTVQLSKGKNRIENKMQENLDLKYSPKRDIRFTSMKNLKTQEITFNQFPQTPKKQNELLNFVQKLNKAAQPVIKSISVNKIEDRALSPKLLLLKSNVHSPESIQKGIVSKGNLLQSGVGKLNTSKIDLRNVNSVQNLKKKLSEVKQNTNDNNNKYLQKIVELQKQLKQFKQKISGLQLDIKLKQSNYKYIQKDLLTKKQKIQYLQIEIKQLNKKIINYQQKIRQGQYNIKHTSQQYTQLQHIHQILVKKIQKRDQYNKQVIQKLNQKYYQIQKQKQNLLYKISNLQNQNQQNNKRFNGQLRQKQKKYNEQRVLFMKKINLLQKTLQQKKIQYENILQKLKNIQKQYQQLKINNDKILNELIKLKNKIQQLNILLSKQIMQKNVLQQQLKQYKIISQQNKILKQLIESKDQQIDNNIRKLTKMQQQLCDNQQKIKQLEINIHNLQDQYQKLYYQNIGQNQQAQRKKKIINNLIEQNQSMQKNIQKLNFTLKNQSNQFQQQRLQFQQNLKNIKIEYDKLQLNYKQTKNQLLQQIERRKMFQKQVVDYKKRIDYLQNQIENLQQDINSKIQQLNKTKGLNNISSQVEELKRIKDEKQSKVGRLTSENEALMKSKDEQIQQYQQSIDKLNGQIEQLNNHNNEMLQLIQSKKQQIQQLKQQIGLKRNELRQIYQIKSDIQKLNGQCNDKIIDLHEKNERLQQQINQLKFELKQINILLLNLNQQIIDSDLISYNHQNRIKKIKDLFNIIEDKQKNIQEYKSNIQNLQLQISHLKNQAIHLKQQIVLKQASLENNNKNTDDLKKYFDDNLQGLKAQLDQKQTQVLAVSIFKLQHDNRLNETQTTLQKYKQLMDSLTNKISLILNEKDKLLQKIQQLQKGKTRLNIELSKYKLNEQKLNNEIIQLKDMIKQYKQQNQLINNDKRQLNNKLNQLSLKILQMQHLISEYLQKIQDFNKKHHNQQLIIQQYETQLQKQRQKIQKLDQSNHQKFKQMNKKIQSIKLQLTQKSKQLLQVETQKKNRIQILTNNIDQLKKQNFDLQSVAYAQKSNNTKLNSILNQLTSSINKIQKANNIKTYYMIPIKDLLKKFQEIMQASDKMYLQFQKKNNKKQGKIDSNSAQAYQFAQI